LFGQNQNFSQKKNLAPKIDITPKKAHNKLIMEHGMGTDTIVPVDLTPTSNFFIILKITKWTIIPAETEN